MPTSTYQYESGGDPEAIPRLTWNGLKTFHSTHYHPSNGRYLKKQYSFLIKLMFNLN
jgi:Zn-dependent M16 (insulinase) family peptidase